MSGVQCCFVAVRWVVIGPNRAAPAFFFTSALRGKPETGEQAGQPLLSAAQLYGNLLQRIVKFTAASTSASGRFPLLRVKRTCRSNSDTSVFDPFQTSQLTWCKWLTV